MDLSIVIPYFNRADTVRHTLASIDAARGSLRVETILVDDGSTEPASAALADAPHRPDLIIRQENAGLLFARLAGLRAAAAEFVLFLDSDDRIGPEKILRHIEAMRTHQADVSYSDTLHAELTADWASIRPPERWQPSETTTDPATFFIRVQPPPHSPVFRTDWLRRVVDAPLFPPSALYNPVAEIWFYHVAAVHDARVVKVPGVHNLVCHHAGARITGCWEAMAVASLGVMEQFMRACPVDSRTAHVRQLVGEKAFTSWRGLPYDFPAQFQQRMLALWRTAPRGPLSRLGGPQFQRIARVVGPRLAGLMLRRLRGGNYASCRTPSGLERLHADLLRLDSTLPRHA